MALLEREWPLAKTNRLWMGERSHPVRGTFSAKDEHVSKSVPAGHAETSNAVAARRRIPDVYVIDASGQIVLKGAKQPLSPTAMAVVGRLLVAARSGDGAAVGLSGKNEIVRLIPLAGGAERHFALFIEPGGERDLLSTACKRYALTSRERDVLRMLLRGSPTREIAHTLRISEATAITHVRNIGAKVQISKRTEIVAAVLAAA